MTQFQSSAPAPAGNSGGPFEIGSFDFHGKPVVVLTNETDSWAVLGQLCQNLTLDPNGQRQAIERKAWSKGKTCVTHVMLPGQSRAYPQFLIHERIVPMWLANVTSSRIEDPSIRANVEQAQVELADALHAYVSSRRPAREPSKLEVARDLVAALEAKEALEAANKILAPKAGKWDRFCNSDGLIDMAAAAQAFHHVSGGLGRTKFMQRLRDGDVRFLQVQNRRIPYECHVQKGRAEVKFVEAGNGRWVEQTFLTPKGMDWLADKFGAGKSPLPAA